MEMLNINNIIEKIKEHPKYEKVGMILYHVGVVRSTSRNGQNVSGIEIKTDYNLLKKIVNENKTREGIVEIIVKINNKGFLKVGENIMIIAVAGDIRENVINTMTLTLNTIKEKVTKKKEFYV